MASITVYTFPFSHNGVRPELALREKGLDFRRVDVDLFKGEHRKPPLSELTPRGQIPTLVYDDGAATGPIVVYESIAIIRFLDDLHPESPLMPPATEPRRRADATMRIEEFQAKLDPKNIFGSVVFGKQDRTQLGKRVDDLIAELGRWDGYLEGRQYLAGDQFTLADIAVFPLLLHFEALGFDYAGRTPALAAYFAACQKRPSVVATGWVERFRESLEPLAPMQVLAEAAPG